MVEYFRPAGPNIPETLGPAGLKSNPDNTSDIFSPGIKIVLSCLIYLKYSFQPDQILHDRVSPDNRPTSDDWFANVVNTHHGVFVQ